MIFRTITTKDGFEVSVEDEEVVLFTVLASTREEAAELVRRAVMDGFETIRPEPVKKKAK